MRDDRIGRSKHLSELFSRIV